MFTGCILPSNIQETCCGCSYYTTNIYQHKQCTIIREILQNYHTFALLDPSKMGDLMIPVWIKAHKVSASAMGDVCKKANKCSCNNNIEVFKSKKIPNTSTFNTERQNASLKEGKNILGFHVKLQRCMNHSIEKQTVKLDHFISFPPTWGEHTPSENTT